MIPTIGIMIGGYIIFRCIEIACRSKSSFASDGARTAVVVAAIIGIAATACLTMSLLFPSSGILGAFSGTTANVENSRPENCRDPNEVLGATGLCWCKEGYKRDVTSQKCVPDR